MLKLPNIPEALAKEISSKLMYELNSPKLNGEKLEICYEQVDKLLQTIKEYFPCKPKCSFCCKHDVVITQFEAEYISLKTGIKINSKRKINLRIQSSKVKVNIFLQKTS